jgi:hypothetical protein
MRIGDFTLPLAACSMVNIMEISEGGVSRDLIELSRQNVQLCISSTEMLTCDVHSTLGTSFRQTASVL